MILGYPWDIIYEILHDFQGGSFTEYLYMVPSVDRIVSLLKFFKNARSLDNNDNNDHSVFTRINAYFRNVNIIISYHSKASEKLSQYFELAEHYLSLF